MSLDNLIVKDEKEIKEEPKLLKGQATPEQLAEWKAKFGQVWEVEVDGSIAYFKKPSRAALRAALTFVDKDKVKYMEVVVSNCWLGGDENMKEDDDMFFAMAGSVVPELTAVKHAAVKKH